MESVNALIVHLVTASNDVAASDRNGLADLARSAAREIRARQPDGDPTDLLPLLDRVSAEAGATPGEAWQAVLRRAAETLRALQPMVEPERALPAHRPDGGDGGNY